MTERYLAAERPEFMDPSESKPPLGTKLLILTRGGVVVIGLWDVEQGAIAWAPLPKIPLQLKQRLSI